MLKSGIYRHKSNEGEYYPYQRELSYDTTKYSQAFPGADKQRYILIVNKVDRLEASTNHFDGIRS